MSESQKDLKPQSQDNPKDQSSQTETLTNKEDPKNISENNTENEQQKELINKVINDISKDVYDLSKKHNIIAYQLSFLHNDIKIPIVLFNGHIYHASRLASYAHALLQERMVS